MKKAQDFADLCEQQPQHALIHLPGRGPRDSAADPGGASCGHLGMSSSREGSRATPSFLGRSGAGDQGDGRWIAVLLSLAEFYLMSKASLIFSTNPQKSSFSNAAAVYGNATYIHRGHFAWEKEKCENSCCLFVDNWGASA